jgi:DNA-binding transcriptional LysR family regulator
MDLNLIKTFNTVARLGSFTKAANALKQPKSRISRAISKLEENLATQLIRRTTRQSVLTTAGQSFYDATYKLIEELEYQVSIANTIDEEVSGSLRVTAPEDMSNSILPSLISSFQNRFPKVRIDLKITNSFVDLIKDNIDIAFRIGNLKDSNLIQKKIMSVNLILVASKGYLKSHALPKEIKDLKEHKFIPFYLYTEKEEFKKHNLKPMIISDSFQLSLAMALEGHGVTMLPDFFARKYIDSDELIRIIPSWSGNNSTMRLIYSPTKRLPSQVRAFIDFTTKKMSLSE